jgi:hypothetical protein
MGNRCTNFRESRSITSNFEMQIARIDTYKQQDDKLIPPGEYVRP